MRRVFLGLLIFFFSSASSWAQHLSLSGQITDASTGDGLPGATVYLPDLEKGNVTNADGQFNLKGIPAGIYKVRISFVGYATLIKAIPIKSDTLLNLALSPVQEQMEELVVEASAGTTTYNSTLAGITHLKPEDIQSTVAMLGEQDLVKTLQLKPGVQSGSEGSSGFFVRGGQADQNLVLLDGVSIYNPSHLFGVFSVFNSDMLRDVKLYKGSFPARFGGRLSSVLDISLKEGDLQRVKGAGNTGMISSSLMLEGPLLKNKLSWMVSARRTYFDIITRQINQSMADKPEYQPIPDYYFYDMSGKLFFKPTSKDRFSFTFYQGRDKFYFTDERFSFDFLWGNKAGILQWQHLFSNSLSGSFSLSATEYKYRIRNSFEELSQTAGSGIQDLNGAADFTLELARNHYVSFGTSLTRHSFEVLRLQQEEQAEKLELTSSNSEQVPALEGALYISDEWALNKHIGLEGGLRLTSFSAMGNTRLGLEPRMSLRWQAASKLAVKAGYSRAYQYVHLVNSSGTSLPTSFWYPSSSEIKPQIAQQYAIGLEALPHRKWKISNELYYRNMDNQIDFRNGAEVYGNPEVTSDLVFGSGWAYGNEFYVEKTKGNTTGWIGYTLSWTWRKFDELNNGRAFKASHDRRHDISVVINRKLNPRFSVSGTWVYGSGALTTLPPGRFYVQGQRDASSGIIPHYGDRNNFQLANYHRADAGVSYKLRPRWGEASIQLGVYNLYNRRNAYFVYFERLPQNGSQELKLVARQVSLFPVLPSISFTYKF
jgi:outer membrane receptor for ferrienterochelin and colicin